MAGQVWQTNTLGGYMWAPNLSRKLRTALQPMVRYRQFCDAKEAFGVGKGEFFNWNTYSDLQQEGGELDELQVMPEGNFVISQKSLTVNEYGISVPFTKKLDDLSEQPVTEIIHQVLKNDARRVLDRAAHAQFENTLVTFTGSGTEDVAVGTAGTFSGVGIALLNGHVKTISDIIAEREVPTFDGNNYMAVSRPTGLRDFKNNLESIHQYTTEGWHVIMNGEKGRYEGIRFVEQTNIATKGYAATGADQIFFFGADTVVEAFSIPEEIRGKIPTDYGRSRGVAWYALLGYGIVHTASAQTRIFEWGGNDPA